jgi:hypothetical protein
LHAAAARLRARAEGLREHAGALEAVASAEARAAAAAGARKRAISDVDRYTGLAERARGLLLRLLPTVDLSREDDLAARAARVDVALHGRLDAARERAAEAEQEARAAAEARGLARQRLGRAQAALRLTVDPVTRSR